MATIKNDVDKILLYCGFNRISKQKEIADYGFESFEDIMLLTEKDIGNLSKGFSEITVDNGRIIFVLCRTNITK